MRLALFLIAISFTLITVGHAAMAADPVATGAQPSEIAATDSPPLSILWPVSALRTDPVARQNANADFGAARSRITQNQQPAYVLRTGTVMLDTPALATANATTANTSRLASDARAQSADRTQSAHQQRWLLDLFSDTQIELEITSENAPAPGVKAINARELNHEFATFSLTLTPESYLITFADPESSMLYRIVGDSATGYGVITQIDRARMPPVIHLPPRISGEPQ